MKKVTIITGPSGCGKTTLAAQLTEGKKVAFVTPAIGKSCFFAGVKPDTEVIVVEESYSVSQIKAIAYSKQIVIDRNGRIPVEINTPELIFTSNFLTEEDFKAASDIDFKIITLTANSIAS